ncbi:MAG TPA: hypothetical protein VJ851_15340 [Jatrophihabitans sp.]|nr:hypothetical protein [Jatrophihabitans sp.]
MTWLRRGHEPTGSTLRPDSLPDEDSPTELLRAVFTVNRFVNQSSGQLPGRAVVAARRLTDTLREIIDTSQVRPLDVYAVVSVKATLTDYLPTTLRTYLAVGPDVRDLPARSGQTPAQLLMEQLDSLQLSADAVLVAARNQDIDALVNQGNFLRTKFSGSDLDL